MLVGRDRELALIDELLDGARRGHGRVLVLSGDAGIGKTALLERARERAVGMRTLSISAVESESELAFAGLHALVLPVLGLLDRLPERQRRALAAALALEEDEAPAGDALGAYAGTLNLLAEAAAEQPLLVTIDDAHWLDGPSAAAIAFAAHRIAGEDLALLVAVRTEAERPRELAGLDEVVLAPLAEPDALALLAAGGLGPEVARAVAALSEGNPLALVEVSASMSPEQRAGRAPIEGLVPVAERIRQSFLHRLDGLEPASRLSLLAAAAGLDVPLEAIRRAAALLEGGPLESAEAEGLVSLSGGLVSFRHPLLRAAIYHAASPPERRLVHRALADSLPAGDDLRAWQLAAAAEGADAEAAAALEATADRALERGGYASQARALERAADLSPDPADEARHLHSAARAAFWAGRVEHALALCERGLRATTDPLLRVDLICQRAEVASFGRNWPFEPAPFEQELAVVEGRDPDREARLLVGISAGHWSNLHFSLSLEVARRIEPLFELVGDWLRLRAIGSVAQARIGAGAQADAAELLDELFAADPAVAGIFAPCLIWLERHGDAEIAIGAALDRAGAEGNVLLRSHALSSLAALELARGNLQRASAAAVEGRALALDVGAEFVGGLSEVSLARIEAIRGRADACRAAAGSLLAPGFPPEYAAAGQVALGALAVGQADFRAAVSVLEPLHERLAGEGLGDPSVFPYHADLVEALLRTGRADAAARVADELSRLVDLAGRNEPRAVLARCRALLAGAAESEERFAEALDCHPGSPFERARTELAFGESLRRANRRLDARPLLASALECFDRLGAAPWHERARLELNATGERVPRRGDDARDSLTPQELQIATHVAAGKTNREVAEAVFLSVKTVEFHLTRVYRKLDVHSRSDLVRAFADGTAVVSVES